MQLLANWLGMGEAMDRLAHAPTLAAQRAAWESAWFISFCLRAPAWLVDAATRLLALLAFNRFVLWCGPGAVRAIGACPVRCGRARAAARRQGYSRI
jgi:hypothetical protein